jgi:hypothetical protein
MSPAAFLQTAAVRCIVRNVATRLRSLRSLMLRN